MVEKIVFCLKTYKTMKKRKKNKDVNNTEFDLENNLNNIAYFYFS